MKSCAGAPWSITSGSRRKISVTPTKGLLNQRDLALDTRPGWRGREEIVRDPAEARKRLLATLSALRDKWTAVLGLGGNRPLASKPVMEASRYSSRNSPDRLLRYRSE